MSYNTRAHKIIDLIHKEGRLLTGEKWVEYLELIKKEIDMMIDAAKNNPT